jgi:hypothetical protein
VIATAAATGLARSPPNCAAPSPKSRADNHCAIQRGGCLRGLLKNAAVNGKPSITEFIVIPAKAAVTQSRTPQIVALRKREVMHTSLPVFRHARASGYPGAMYPDTAVGGPWVPLSWGRQITSEISEFWRCAQALARKRGPEELTKSLGSRLRGNDETKDL